MGKTMVEEMGSSILSSEDLFQRMSEIYEERDREYEQLNAQYQQREDDLEKTTRLLEAQKEQQEIKEKNLAELKEKLKQIKERLEERTAKLQQREADLEKNTADQKEQIEKEYQKLKESIAAAEAKKQIELNEMRNQKLSLERERGEVRSMKQKLSFGGTEDTETETLKQALSGSKEQIQKLQTMLQQKEEQLTNIQKKADRFSEEEIHKAEEDQQALADMKKQMRELQKEKGEQLRKIIDLSSEIKRLKENQKTEEDYEHSDRIGPEQMEAYLKEQKDFSNIYILHAEDGDIVTSLKGNIHFRFAFKEIPFFDLCVQRNETEQMKETIYELNMRYNYKFCFDRYRSEAVLSSSFLPEISCKDLLYKALEAAKCIGEDAE